MPCKVLLHEGGYERRSQRKKWNLGTARLKGGVAAARVLFGALMFLQVAVYRASQRIVGRQLYTLELCGSHGA